MLTAAEKEAIRAVVKAVDELAETAARKESTNGAYVQLYGALEDLVLAIRHEQ